MRWRHDAIVRTTVDLSDDAYYVARAHAAERRISLGKAISELILAPNAPRTTQVAESRSKYPSVRVDRPLTVERVNELLDDE